MNRDDQIRQQANDIDMRAVDAKILLNTIGEKLDAMDGLNEEDTAHALAMHCFVTCALRNLELLKEHVDHVFELLKVQP